jgi:outer membrane protein OmpA-like peptidoglycan-associated protein
MALDLRTISMGLISATLLTGCATKGFVREQVDVVRTDLSAEIATERQERIAGDEALRTDIAALRSDLQGLREEFGARITAMENGMRFAFPVNFAFDDANVRAEDRPALERFADVANRYYPNATITVEGFADPAGSTAYNQRLSQARAENVRNLLVEQGLNGMNLRAVGYGENRQVVEGAWGDQDGAEKNRRVVFVIEAADATAAGITQNNMN